jgi:MFS transporter, DHA3 family, macrolide efflux protein
MTRHPRQLSFYALLTTQTISLIGSRMTSVALGIWLYRHTGLTTPLLLAAFFTEAPGMLVGAIAGVGVDRWDRKWVMVLADWGQALGSLILLWAFRSGSFRLGHLYAVALLQGAFVVFQSPALTATVSLLVPDERRDRANGLLELSFPLASMLAPALAGILYPLAGVEGIIALDLGSFALAALIVGTLHIPRPPRAVDGRAGRGEWTAELQERLRFFFQRPILLQFVLYQAFIWFAVNSPLELAIPYVISVTGSEQKLGWVMSLMGVGALVGSLTAVALGALRPRVRTIAVGMLLTGSMLLAYGTARSVSRLGLTIFLLMIPLPVSNALLKSIIQAKTPPDLQGHAFAAMEQLFLMGSTSSFLLTGPLADRLLTPVPTERSPRWIQNWIGDGSEAGMRLLLIVTGVLIVVSTTLVLGHSAIRDLEDAVPDYVPGARLESSPGYSCLGGSNNSRYS